MEQINDSMRRMTTTDNNIKMDLESSMGKKDQREETVEELILKLNQKGTKVKVLKDGDQAETPVR